MAIESPLVAPTRLVMGTRGSPLALAQSRLMAAALQAAHPGLEVVEHIIRTTGDKLQAAPLPEIGGKGVFTLELEQALLNGQIDFAVHSLKDLPPLLPAGLCLGAIPKRAAAGDVCILHPNWQTWQQPRPELPLPPLPYGARIGTSSLRRRAQLLRWRPDLQIENIRGNIDTRLRKLEAQDFQAIVLAQAGLERLGVDIPVERQCPLDERDFVPAPGQGALAIEARADDAAVLQILNSIEDKGTRAAISAERATMRALNAGCSTPLGARAVVTESRLAIWGIVLAPDGSRHAFGWMGGAVEDAEIIGQNLAQRLLARGAQELLVPDVHL